MRLLERMAKSAASIIANLRLYQEIVEEKEELLSTFESLHAGIILVTSEGAHRADERQRAGDFRLDRRNRDREVLWMRL